ncbi:MAG TPA: zinc dependent phospholipase C family protein [Phycisphaerae bacterium]|nr:zinc dependent phospholipase C family protein [Phycisphaerae bacterium]
MRPYKVFGLVFFILLAAPSVAQAWGPMTHVKLASDLLGHLQLLPAGLAILLARHRKDFMFGNIAADVVVAKRLSRVRQICHHWETGFSLLEDAGESRGRAFAFGYLCHLAADTIAHGKFIPHQMTLTRTTMSFGHLYWEMRADAALGTRYRHVLRQVLRDVAADHRASLHACMTDTFLPFTMNWGVFYRTNRLVSRGFWRRALWQWAHLSRWHLPGQLMREYRQESLERMVDVLANGREAAVCHEDPSGNAALAYTRIQRRQLRQMARAGLTMPHVYHEAVFPHAPRPNGQFRLPA